MKPLEIHFVTWPEGQLFEGTQTSIDPKFAINAALRSWLIPTFFKDLRLDLTYSPARTELWEAMERAGFKVHSLPVPTDIAEGLSR